MREVSRGRGEHMDRKTTLQGVCSVASYRFLHELPSSRSGSGCEPTRQMKRGEALISTLLLSLGLWALIWGAMAPLPAGA